MPTTCYFLDGFDHYGTPNGEGWTKNSGTWTVSASYARSSATAPAAAQKKGLKIPDSSSDYIWRQFSENGIGPTFAIGFDIYHEGTFYGGNVDAIYLRSGGSTGTIMFTIKLMTDKSVVFEMGSTTTLLQSAADAISAGWNRIEAQVTIGDTDGSASLWINDVLEDTDASSGFDTQISTETDVDTIQINSLWGAVGQNVYIDNLYIAAARIQGLRVDTFLPTADGFHSDFLSSDSSGADIYSDIDDAVPDDDTTYIESDTVGDQYSVTFPTQSSAQTIHGVQSSVLCENPDVGAISVQHLVRDGSVDYLCGDSSGDGNTHSVPTSWSALAECYSLDPSDDTEWTDAKINGKEWGLEVISKG